jgi:hypothetical protein
MKKFRKTAVCGGEIALKRLGYRERILAMGWFRKKAF